MTTDTHTTHLTAEHLSDGWTVVDDRGGRWTPDLAASTEIDRADDPAAAAVAMCHHEPLRGTWAD